MFLKWILEFSGKLWEVSYVAELTINAFRELGAANLDRILGNNNNQIKSNGKRVITSQQQPAEIFGLRA